VAVDRDHPLAVADAADDVAHGIDAHLVVAELLHLGLDALDDRAFLAAQRLDGNEVLHEAQQGAFVLPRQIKILAHGFSFYIPGSSRRWKSAGTVFPDVGTFFRCL
jgi:hypothetical protein